MYCSSNLDELETKKKYIRKLETKKKIHSETSPEYPFYDSPN